MGNWKLTKFDLSYNVVWCSHLKIWRAAAGYFEGNIKLCTFSEKERNVKPLPFAASPQLKMRKEGVEEKKERQKLDRVIFRQATHQTNSLLHRQTNFTNWTFSSIWICVKNYMFWCAGRHLKSWIWIKLTLTLSIFCKLCSLFSHCWNLR